jgi:hypothetical protein
MAGLEHDSMDDTFVKPAFEAIRARREKSETSRTWQDGNAAVVRRSEIASLKKLWRVGLWGWN